MDEKQLLLIRKLALKYGLEPPSTEEILKKVNEQYEYSPTSTEDERLDEFNENQKNIHKEKLIIGHGNQIGLLKLQMSKEEINQCLDIYRKQYNDEVAASFLCEYDESGNVYAIQLVIESLKKYFKCEFKGIDIFQAKAKDIILHFDLLNPYVRDSDSELGFMYVFPTLGISFWRGNVCNEEDLEADWFKELIPENQADTKRFLYFETVRFSTMSNS